MIHSIEGNLKINGKYYTLAMEIDDQDPLAFAKHKAYTFGEFIARSVLYATGIEQKISDEIEQKIEQLKG